MNPQESNPKRFLGRAADRLRSTIRSSRRGVKDVAVSLVPHASKSLTGFLASILLARGLGPTGMGQYALVISLSDAVTTLSDLGIGQTAIRYASLSASQNDTAGQLAVLRWAFRLRILLTVLMAVVLFMAAPILTDWVWHVEGLTQPIRISLFIALFAALAGVPSLYFQSLRRFGMNSVVLTGQTLLTLIGVGILAVIGRWSVSAVVSVTAITAGIGAFAFLIRVPKEALVSTSRLDGRKGKGLKNFWKVPLSDQVKSSKLDNSSGEQFAMYIMLSTIIVMITLKLDVWLMGIFLDKSEIGFYNVATRFGLPLTLVLSALNTALWPRASAVRTRLEVQSLLVKTFKGSALVATASLLYAFFVPMLAPVFFGEAYNKSVQLAQVLSLGHCVNILFNPLGVIGYAIGMVRVYWVVNLLQLLLVIVMLITLLPAYGAMGAAITFVASTIFGSVIVTFILWRTIRRDFVKTDVPQV